MDRDPILIYGAGGHAKVVAEVADALGLPVEAFLEDSDARDGEPFFGARILSWARLRSDPGRWAGLRVAPAIGDNAGRAAAAERLRAIGLAPATLVHPSAVVSRSATIGEGTVIMPVAVVNADAVVGSGVILNSGAVVEHDSTIGDFAHLSPKAALGGGVRVGERAHIGLGAVALPRVRIGADARIGAGAVVNRDVPAGATFVGVPARPIRRQRSDGADREHPQGSP